MQPLIASWRTARGRRRLGAAVLGASVLALLAGAPTTASAQEDQDLSTSAKSSSKVKFDMVRSVAASLANCAPTAEATVTVQSSGDVGQKLTIKAKGLPRSADFDLFVTQSPNAPFGVAWYVGDVHSNSSGKASASFVGVFSAETFAISQGIVATPRPHTAEPFPDAVSNPTFKPVHTYHLGLWFDSQAAAAAVGCPNTETPFNGTHTAGIQLLTTSNFPDLAGPLSGVTP